MYVRACELSRFGHVQLFATPRTVAHQAPLSMEFFRQQYLSGLPSPPPGIFPTQGSKPPLLLSSLALVGGFFTTWEALFHVQLCLKRYLLVLECLLLVILIGSLNHFSLYK